MDSWIGESAKKSKTLRKQYKLRDIEIFIKDKLPEEVDPDFVLKYTASVVPEHLLTNIDIIYIGQFESLIKRDVRGIFEDPTKVESCSTAATCACFNPEVDEFPFPDTLVPKLVAAIMERELFVSEKNIDDLTNDSVDNATRAVQKR